jgi:hypothetical protein
LTACLDTRQTQRVQQRLWEPTSVLSPSVYAHYIPTATHDVVLPWKPPHPASGNTFQQSNARSKSGTPPHCVAMHKDQGSNLGLETGYHGTFLGILLSMLVTQRQHGGQTKDGWPTNRGSIHSRVSSSSP